MKTLSSYFIVLACLKLYQQAIVNNEIKVVKNYEPIFNVNLKTAFSYLFCETQISLMDFVNKDFNNDHIF